MAEIQQTLLSQFSHQVEFFTDSQISTHPMNNTYNTQQ